MTLRKVVPLLFALHAASLSAAQRDFYDSITVGNEKFVAGPPVKLGQSLSKVEYSPSGNAVIFIEERPEDPYQIERDRISRGQTTNRRYVARFDIKSGVKTVVYEVGKDEVVMDIDPVGPNGGVICSLVTGKSTGDNLVWKVVYCPFGQTARVVQDRIVGRSLSLAGSKTDERAFIFSCGLGCPTVVSYVTANGQKSTKLTQEAYQGGVWAGRTVDGDPILTLQGPQPDYKLLGNYKLSFATGTVVPLAELPEIQPPGGDVKPKFVFNDVPRSTGDPQLGQSPLIDIVAESTERSRGKLLLTQGAIISVLTEPLGRSVVYLSGEGGYFLREIVLVVPKA